MSITITSVMVFDGIGRRTISSLSKKGYRTLKSR